MIVDRSMVCMEFEVLPESSLRNDIVELVLGTPINQVIAALQNASKVIRNVDLIYSKEEPFEKDVTITLKNDGIRLTFDAETQVLKLIEVYDFKNITLKYCESIFSSPEEEANINKIEKVFGATLPGVYDEKQKMYLLKWRGVCFCFPAKDSSTIQSYAHGLGSLQFSNNAVPCLHRMMIYSGNNPSELRTPEIPLAAFCGNTQLKCVESLSQNSRIIGLKFIYFAEDALPNSTKKLSTPPSFERVVRLGDTEQTVLSCLGAPNRVFFKNDDKMLIQRGSNPVKIDDTKPDLFFNYFTLGTDILIDNDTRRVQKFILHTNIPGHYDFGIYAKCTFTITVPDINTCIKTDSKLEDFRHIFMTPDEDGGQIIKPVVLNKSSTNGGENPFGSTFCYGRNQLIMEILDNSYIATVIIYDERQFPSDDSSQSSLDFSE